MKRIIILFLIILLSNTCYAYVTNTDLDRVLADEGNQDCVELWKHAIGDDAPKTENNAGDTLLPQVGNRNQEVLLSDPVARKLTISGLDKNEIYTVGLGMDWEGGKNGISVNHMGYIRWNPNYENEQGEIEPTWTIVHGGTNRAAREDKLDSYLATWGGENVPKDKRKIYIFDQSKLGPNPERSCFLPTTLISTPTIQVEIQDIKEGDSILSFDLTKNIPIISKVLHIFKRKENNYMIINNKMKVTPYHYIYVKKVKNI